MLGYNKQQHLVLLRERLEAVSAAEPQGSTSERPFHTEAAPDEREELMRHLMVTHLGRMRRLPAVAPHEFARALEAYLACCDPADLRQVDVLHNLYESVRGEHLAQGSFAGMQGGYASLLRSHIDQLEAGQIRGHSVGLGERTTLEPHSGPLRVLLLADNFLSASRAWHFAVEGGATKQPRLLFCNNAGQSRLVYLSRLMASLAVLVANGGLRLGLSMLRRRPRVSTVPLDHPSSTAWLRSHAFDIGLHNMGVIYRKQTIATFRLGILNAHIGYLPGMRGRSVLEWSLVLGVDPCVSTFFIDEGIDTGPLIVDRYLPPPETVRSASSIEEAKRRLFDLDGLCYQRALAKLVQGGEGVRNVPAGPRFYVMSRLLAASITGGRPNSAAGGPPT